VCCTPSICGALLLLLIGGDKTGDLKWYEKLVPIADDLLDQHLKSLRSKRR
jgi:hypothetical protein